MDGRDFKFASKDGTDIYVTKWTTKDDIKPKAVVQIAHGMAEHIKRYEDFAKSLVEEGYIVYGSDHRGHGRTAGSPENIGYFADENGWDLVVEDMNVGNWGHRHDKMLAGLTLYYRDSSKTINLYTSKTHRNIEYLDMYKLSFAI